MALVYPRFVVNDFSPMFRLVNDLQGASRPNRCAGRYAAYKQRTFQPRFDVTETRDSYELKGELPGIDQKNIEVAFTDEKTLTIKGHTDSHREGCPRRSAQPESQAEQATEQATEKAAATEGETEQAPVPVSDDDASSYHKASVEDEYVDVASESEATMSGGNPDAAPVETPKAVETEKQEAAAPKKTECSRRWISERSRGSFTRSWTFPRRVDQDAVTASLKDGILSVVVPKVVLPENRRVEIQ